MNSNDFIDANAENSLIQLSHSNFTYPDPTFTSTYSYHNQHPSKCIEYEFLFLIA